MAAQISTELPKRVTSDNGVRLLARPVTGSVTLGKMPLQPHPKAAWSKLLPVEPETPAAARQTTRWFLSNCRDVDADTIETAVLLVSELVTNAFNALSNDMNGRPVIELSLRLFAGRLLVEVIDSSPHPPVLSPSGPDAPTGRGLPIVGELSREWGYFRHNGRKVVFFILEARNGAPVHHDD